MGVAKKAKARSEVVRSWTNTRGDGEFQPSPGPKCGPNAAKWSLKRPPSLKSMTMQEVTNDLEKAINPSDQVSSRQLCRDILTSLACSFSALFMNPF